MPSKSSSALYRRAIYGWIVRIVRNTAEVENLTPETFWSIYRGRVSRWWPSLNPIDTDPASEA